ncbi:MAG: hypothetical protein SPE18_05575 [Candidatus Limivicinus sp.]|nr:hypothetical protein [Candidatus Limivicinus sp.]
MGKNIIVILLSVILILFALILFALVKILAALKKPENSGKNSPFPPENKAPASSGAASAPTAAARENAPSSSVQAVETGFSENTSKLAAAAQKNTPSFSAPARTEEMIAGYPSSVGKLSDLVSAYKAAGPQKHYTDQEKVLLLELGQSFFAGRPCILENSSGNREDDICTAMLQIADLANRFYNDFRQNYFPASASFSDSDSRIEFRVGFYSYSGYCYDGGCYTDESEYYEYYYYFSIISNSDWESRSPKEPLSPRWGNFIICSPFLHDAPAYQADNGRSLYIYKPFGMCDSLKIDFNRVES